MFNSANFYVLQKFWVSCQFLKATQNDSLFLKRILWIQIEQKVFLT